MTIAAFARWSGFSRTHVESLLNGRYIPYYESGYRIEVDPLEVVEHIRTRNRVPLNPAIGRTSEIPPPDDSRHEVGDFPFQILRRYARSCGDGDEAGYMRLYRKIKKKVLPHYKLKGLILLDPQEIESFLAIGGRVKSMDEELDLLR